MAKTSPHEASWYELIWVYLCDLWAVWVGGLGVFGLRTASLSDAIVFERCLGFFPLGHQGIEVCGQLVAFLLHQSDL